MTIALLLYSILTVIPASGWSYPMITVDQWSYSSVQDKPLILTGTDTLHMFWENFNQETRIGYKVYLPDGTIIYPETMVSADVWSGYPTATLLPTDRVAGVWRQGTPAWYCVRDSIGGEVIPASFMLPDPYWGRPDVEMASDSLGRIHATFENGTNTCYSVIEPGVGEVWRDTLPGSTFKSSKVLVHGNRVHIFYLQPSQDPYYIQYDLEGNIVVPPVSVIDDVSNFHFNSSAALDTYGNPYLFCRASHGTGYYLSVSKVDASTGQVAFSERVIRNPSYDTNYPVILGHPSGNQMYLLWEEVDPDHPYVMFASINTEGNFLSEPYAAYDYSDEEIQNISEIAATINEVGDIFAIWSQGDVEVGGYWIVLGWAHSDSVGISVEIESPDAVLLSLSCSMNPFTSGVIITAEGSHIPGQLVVFDLSGRIVRTLFKSGGDTFLWDGCSSSGEELPVGSYTIQGASAGRLTSVTVVKL